jgi:copper homeostasis protein
VNVRVEACVTTLEEARACVEAGGRRLELCEDLTVDGLTPSTALVEGVVAEVGVPTFVMVRPRPGSFVYTADEVLRMERDIRILRDVGAQGIVVGALTSEGDVDADVLTRLVGAAGPLPVTFHRAFDLASNGERALDALVGAGVSRVLTGGGPGRAIDQVGELSKLVRLAGDDIGVIGAGGVRGGHVLELIRATGLREVHARAEGVGGVVDALP